MTNDVKKPQRERTLITATFQPRLQLDEPDYELQQFNKNVSGTSFSSIVHGLLCTRAKAYQWK